MPVEWVRGPEQDHLRRVPGGGEVHRRGIDGHEQARLADERGQGEQVGFAGEIDRVRFRGRFDGGNLRLLHG